MFANSIRLFRLFGFEVKLDASWILLAILISWSLAVGYFPAVSPGLDPVVYWSMGIVGLIGLAFSIVVHELAHSLVARRFDMPIRGITLFIFGGVAEMRQEPTSPKGEFLMAIAGPAMSLVVAFGFAALGYAFGGAEVVPAEAGAGPRVDAPPVVLVLSYLAFINLLLALFNLIPAFPLDGGRMLRAALWGWKGDIVWATRIAAGAGSVFAFALMALGLFNVISGNWIGGIWYFILGLFVRSAAMGQVQHQSSQSALKDRPVHRFMRADPVAVDPDVTLDQLVEAYFYRHYFKTLPVARDGRFLGAVSVEQIRHAGDDVEASPHLWTVGAIMRPAEEAMTIAPDADAAEALEKMQMGRAGRLWVVDGDRLVGVLSLRDLSHYLELRRDLEPIVHPAQQARG
ncbi:MAG: CBS domain-containing protein [Alphaproteobacteria bacterium]|jgi:Zn-dependent protease/CBS domain-containing protein|nr:CBS domain-containing protein [Alphaproteobacteria bacterium]